jgi:hypothetical protein
VSIRSRRASCASSLSIGSEWVTARRSGCWRWADSREIRAAILRAKTSQELGRVTLAHARFAERFRSARQNLALHQKLLLPPRSALLRVARLNRGFWKLNQWPPSQLLLASIAQSWGTTSPTALRHLTVCSVISMVTLLGCAHLCPSHRL